MADRSVLVRIRGDASDLVRATAAARAALGGLRREIDTTNDRTAWLAQGFLALGPALVPLGAAAVPMLAGLATQMTVAGIAAGSMGLAFNGVGDAMKALNEYQLEPTAANLEKVRQTMDQIGPAGEDFVRFLDSVGPQFTALQMAAREGMFPGMEEGLNELLDLLPQVEDVVSNVSRSIGELAADTGAGLSGEGFADFFDYLENEAAPTLVAMGHTFGNFAEGLANMLVEFAPLSDDFTQGLLHMSEAFVDWTDNLSNNPGFQEFIDYVQKSVPKALDLFGSIVDAFVQIVEAAAPVGNLMLPALEGLFDVIAAIADTPFGTLFIGAAAAMSAYGRAAALASITTSGLGKALFGLDRNFVSTARGARGAVAAMGTIRSAMGAAAGGMGLFALSMTDVDDKAGLANTAMGTMAGLMIGGPWGAAIGFGIGATADFAAAHNEAADAVDAVNEAIAHGSRSDQMSAINRARDALAAAEGNPLRGLVADQNALRTAISEGRDAMHSSNDIADMLGGTIGKTGAEMRAAADDAALLTIQLEILNGFFSKRAAIRNYEAAFDDLAKTLHKGSRNWDVNTEKGRKNQEMLDNVGTSIAQVAEQIEGRKARATFLRDALKDLGGLQKLSPAARHAIQLVIDRLKDLDHTEAEPKVDADTRPAHRKLTEAQRGITKWNTTRGMANVDANNSRATEKITTTDRLLNELTRTPRTAKIDADASGVQTAAATARAALASIPDETVWITTRKRGTGMGAVADGGTIGGQRQPYGDKAFYMLAPGEEVISNRYGQADRHRDLLKAINANRYADGGTVGRAQVAASSSRTVIERVVERLPATITLDAGELGMVVIDTVDGRIGDHRAHDRAQAATVWSGVSND